MITIRLPAGHRGSEQARNAAGLCPKWAHGIPCACGLSPGGTLREFVESRAGHRDQQALKAALDAWFAEVRKANWSNTADVKRLYSSASIVSSDRIVFNIRGNAYRLVVAADFEKGIVWIKWLGTHRDYDRIDVREVDRD
jgi:mRNA interferase HigB